MSCCFTCGEPARYRCPACDVRSCSIACINKHKVSQACSGKRQAATFHAIGEFDDSVLHRDYQFLESVSRVIDSGKRSRPTCESSAPVHHTERLAPARHQLLQRARERTMWLELLPHGMQRQRENTSRYDSKRRQICWRLELHFDQSDVRHVVANVAESTTLRDVLRPLIGEGDTASNGATEGDSATAADGGASDPGAGVGTECTSSSTRDRQRAIPATAAQRSGVDAGQRALLHHQLRAYAAAGEAQLAAFLPVPHRRADDERFYKLPLNTSLLDALHKKKVIEFPIIHVAIRGEGAERFPLIESSE